MRREILLILLAFTTPLMAKVDFSEFNDVKSAVYLAFDELKENALDELTINKAIEGTENFWWNLEDAHASYGVSEHEDYLEHLVFVFGGFARLSYMNADTLALTFCHELGHGLGGDPLKDNGSSTEGQADYFSTNTCLPIIFKYLMQKSFSQDPYIISYCSKHSKDPSFCERAMESLKGDIAFFKNKGQDCALNKKSLGQADIIDTNSWFYPSAQCRIDTMINGIIKIQRPGCWFPGGQERQL